MALDHRTGTRFGDYLLQDVVGKGGMGVVYRAIHEPTGEVRAVKLMLPELAASDDFRERFIREAELGPGLDHQNIIPIYESGETDGELFIAMKLIEGPDLKTVIKDEGPLEPKRILSLLSQVASALDAAHEVGVVHRDVKPQNILLTADHVSRKELVFVTDFGLVKPTAAESTMSRTGQVFGSIQYMAPEQVEGLPADGRADVYALGCVLYECLTGEIPFDRPNEVAVLWAHVHEDPPRVTDKRPEVPGGLDEVIVRALAKHPDDRYMTCGELVAQLELGLQKMRRPYVLPVVRPLIQRKPREKTEREVWASNFFPELSRVRKASNRVNWFQVVSVTLLFCLVAAGMVEFAHPRGITGAANDVARAVGGPIQDAGRKIAATFSDQQVDSDSIRSAAASGTRGRTRVGALGKAGTDELGAAAPVPADDGEGRVATKVPPNSPPLTGTILFESTRSTPGVCCDYGIWAMDADGSDLREIYNDPTRDEYDAMWSPKGDKIAFIQDTSLMIMDADGRNRREIFSDGWVQDPAWSPDGTRIAFSRHDRTDAGPMDDGWDVWLVNADGSGAHLLTGLRGFDRFPAWSSAREVAFAADRRDNIDIYTSNLTGGDIRRVTRAASSEFMPALAPDGERIAYVANRGGGFNIFVKGLPLRSPENRVTRTFQAFAPSWSVDGNWIAFSGGRRKGFEIWGENDILLVRSTGKGKPIRWTVDPPKTGYLEVWDFDPSWI